MTEKDFSAQALSHAESLYNTALRMSRNAQDSEDLVQDTFYKAFRSLKQFQEGTNFRAWLFKILVNTYISKYRKATKEKGTSGYDDVEEFSLYGQVHNRLETPTDTPSQMLDRFLSEDIKKAIDRLPDVFREVVLLVEIEGFSYQEAADMLETPVGTIMSRLFRGRKILQKSLWDYAVDYGYVKEKKKEK